MNSTSGHGALMDRAFFMSSNYRNFLKNYQICVLRLSDNFNNTFKKYGSVCVLASLKEFLFI
jgi:hypothetical protein